MGPLDPPGGASTSVDVLFNNMSTGSTDSSGYPLDIVDPVGPLGWIPYIQWIHLNGFTGSTVSSVSTGPI